MIILNTIEQLKEANSSVTSTFDLKSITSFLNKSELDIIQLIGLDTINKILLDNDLSIYLRKIIADLALAEYSSSGSMLLDNSGFYVRKSSNANPASDKKLLNFKLDTLNRAWLTVEQLTSKLEAKLDEFPEWRDSAERLAYFSSIFFNSSEFSSFAGISISPTLFKILKPLILRIEEDVLYPNFGEALVDDLKIKRLSNNMDIPYKKLERKLMRIVAPLVISEAIPLQMITLKEGNVFQASISAIGNTSDNIQAFSSVEINRLSIILGKLESEGNSILEKTKKWIIPLIHEYPLYGGATTSIDRESINSSDSNIYLL